MFSLSYDHDSLVLDARLNDDQASRQRRAKLALASVKGNGFDLSRLDLK
ncbi:hypothetical protein GCM10008955_41940 [Deinococcus malanensis]|uniref:Uncharacterized protein n=1 Tax=Deinococcus malanensis TaxID=1706855 RepID=A0ABQ2F5J1_9DEIO|nr:hypothetical protein [Deinococcus malanensis]GGK43782.1 hypothetical protein GCM10008955_41940 [Deinococcus malanensis]